MIIFKAIKLYKRMGAGSFFRRSAHFLLKKIKILFPEMFFAKLEFYILLGYWPDLKNPASFNEKIFIRKMGPYSTLFSTVADKQAVRDYVAEKGCKELLVESLWTGTSPEEIPFDDLPDKFVIKATHGSGWNIIVSDKKELNKEKTIETCRNWLSLKYSESFGEKHYDQVTPGLLIEAFIEDGKNEIPVDYKFFCFQGKARYIQVDSSRFKNLKRAIYDIDWKRMPFTLSYPLAEVIPKPELLHEMIEISENLSRDFNFCRIDLYCTNKNKVFFGEITLTPAAGLGCFYPRSWDYKLGDLWSFPS